MAEDKAIVLFDGICNLCNSTVQFIIRHDSKDYFRFASLQSDYCRQLLADKQLPPGQMDSIVLVIHGETYTKSGAVLRIARHLGGLWKMSGIFFLIPRFIRDAAYDLIAKNRYKWFGKREQCMVPTKDMKAKFYGEGSAQSNPDSALKI